MVNIPMRTSALQDINSIEGINVKTQDTKTAGNILSINMPMRSVAAGLAHSSSSGRTPVPAAGSSGVGAVQDVPPSSVSGMAVPALVNQIQKGQKIPLDPSGTVRRIKVCLGWNVRNPKCDIDVSAFILGADNKALGDDWFVFYGQEDSPDGTIHFSLSNSGDREYISLDLSRMDRRVNKVVFVLTINDALQNGLNFSMVKDAYIRILNADNSHELVSYKMTDYYSNVISMVIGEIYLHNGNWKCNAIGSGIARDLAGLCEMYGVQVV